MQVTPKENARFLALLKAMKREEPPEFPLVSTHCCDQTQPSVAVLWSVLQRTLLEAMRREEPPEFPLVRDCIPQFRRQELQTACRGVLGRPASISASGFADFALLAVTPWSSGLQVHDSWLPPAIAHKFVPAVLTCPLRCPTLNPQDASLLPAVHARVRLAVRLDELERKQSKAGGSAFVPVLSSGGHHPPLMCWAAKASNWFGVGSCRICPHWVFQLGSHTMPSPAPVSSAATAPCLCCILWR